MQQRGAVLPDLYRLGALLADLFDPAPQPIEIDPPNDHCAYTISPEDNLCYGQISFFILDDKMLSLRHGKETQSATPTAWLVSVDVRAPTLAAR